MPEFSESRCERAAHVLLEAVHAEAAKIERLQTGLLYLLGLQIKRAVERGTVPAYDQEVREALLAAADQVQRELGHRHIASAHLLYAVAALQSGVARAVLAHHGVTPEDIKEALKRRIKRYAGTQERPLTTGASEVLGEAQQVARRRAADRTRGEHVLEALTEQALQETHGSTAAVFKIGCPCARSCGAKATRPSFRCNLKLCKKSWRHSGHWAAFR